MAGEVAGIGFLATLRGGAVGRAGAAHRAGDFRGAAETAHQQPGREGGRRAGMPAFCRVNGAPGTLQGVIARQTHRLVEQQDTVERTPASFSHRRIRKKKAATAAAVGRAAGRERVSKAWPTRTALKNEEI